MRTLALVFIFCFLNSPFAHAAVNLQGTVKNENSQGVANARVFLKKVPAVAAMTDASGVFALSGPVCGSATDDSLVVIARGYRNVILALSTYEKNDIAVTLVASNPWKPAGPLEYRGGMVKIRAKDHDFEMGQPCDTVRGLVWDMPTTNVEQPVHTVQFTYDFWMDTVEVTQGIYDSIMQRIYPDKYSRPTWNGSNGLGARWAAYSIEWGSAALFCNARSKSEGLPDTAYSYSGITGRVGVLCTLQNVSVNLHARAYRLPTEAEWEYAYRAGTATDYYWGKEFDAYRGGTANAEVDSHAIWTNNSFGLGKDNVVRLGPGLDSNYYGTHEAGKRKPNAYGLYDMAGNLSEWCNDWYDYYPWGIVTDPAGPNPTDQTRFTRVQRGGNWSNDVTYLRATERQFDAADYKFLFCGFRTVSSGLTSGITRTGSRPHGMTPLLRVRSGTLYVDNATGCELRLFSLEGKRVASAVAHRRQFAFDIRSLPRGSYIATLTPRMLSGTIIRVLE